MSDHPMMQFFQVFSRQADAQISFFTNVTKNMIDTTQRVGAINLDVARRLMQSSSGNSLAALDTLQPTPGTADQASPASTSTDLNAFQQDMQQIVDTKQKGFDKTVDATRQQFDETAASVAKRTEEHTPTADDHITHEPSPLVEKMIASVVEPPQKPQRKR